MNFQSFYGATIREALDKARTQLGPDAAILASRQTSGPESRLGRYEVVCSVSPGIPEAPPVAPPVAPRVATRIPSGYEVIRKRVSSIRAAVLHDRAEEPAAVAGDELAAALRADGFSGELIEELLGGARRRMRTTRGDVDAATALRGELSARLRVDATLGRSQGVRKIVALVGPPGVGKTSLLVRLAVRYGLTGRTPVRLVSLDGARVGGAHALETYAAGMAVPLDVLETGASLAALLESSRGPGLTLIDTPGLSPADLPAAEEIAAVLARHSEIDVHLVIAATASAADQAAAFARFRPFLPAKIAVTQVDNAVSPRSAVALSLANETAISFLTTGPRVPEDLEEASAAALLHRGDRTRGRSAVSAA